MRVSIVSSLFHKKLYSQLVSLVEKEKERDTEPLSSKILYYLALSYANLKDVEKALQVFDEVIDSSIGITYNYQCHMLKGYLLVQMKKYNLASVEFLTLINNGYESVMVYGALGHVFCMLGDNELSLLYLEKAVNLDSENLNALNSLSYVLANTTSRIHEAKSLIEKVLSKEPTNPSFLDTYGYVLLKLQKFKDADKVLTYALTLNPHPTIREHLHEVQRHL